MFFQLREQERQIAALRASHIVQNQAGGRVITLRLCTSMCTSHSPPPEFGVGNPKTISTSGVARSAVIQCGRYLCCHAALLTASPWNSCDKRRQRLCVGIAPHEQDVKADITPPLQICFHPLKEGVGLQITPPEKGGVRPPVLGDRLPGDLAAIWHIHR